ncbi:MAG: SDR family oxidoreductase [Burkholderiaceae bacterium]
MSDTRVTLERPLGPILVTGANGFVGRAVVDHLKRQGRAVRGAVRAARQRDAHGATDTRPSPDLDARADWSALLEACDAVVHTAARVHVMHEQATDALAAFRAVNVDGTLRLARQAADAGVRRFIFISSIKVNGERTEAGRPFTADDAPAPVDAYGRSKAEAEDALRRLATDTDMEVTIIRPPLVYGPGVKANFRSLIRCLERGIPLPLGAVTENRRSLLGLDNLVDLIALCLVHRSAGNQTFLAADGEDLSTAELLRRLARAIGVSARLLPVPMWMLEGAGRLLGKEAVVQRVCGDLQVDIGKTRERLGWRPPVGVDAGLARVGESDG